MNTVDQRKKSTGCKKKIDISKIEKQSNKHVTFSKRRQGLFKKATELCILCDVNIAMIVSSPADKLFSFGRPDTDTVLNNYINGTTEFEDEESMGSNSSIYEEYNREYEEALKMLELEKKKVVESEKLGKARGEWWNDSIVDMNCEELEQFMVSIYEFRKKLVEKEHEHLKMFSMQ